MAVSNNDEKPVEFVGNQISLARMQAGQKGKIVGINGGQGLVRRLEALGIKEGKEIKKISEQWMRGPVILQYGNTQVALGFGMASKVMVQITRRNQ